MCIRCQGKKRWWVAGVCVAVLVFTIMVFPPIVQHIVEDQKWMHCDQNLKNIGLAIQNYEQEHGSLPPAYLTDRNGQPTLSWRVLILPYFGYDDLYRQIKLDEPWNSPHNLRFARRMPLDFRCPSDSDAKEGETSYVAVIGPETLWPGAESKAIPDLNSTSRTILLVEVADSGISWMEPRDLPFGVAAQGVAKGVEAGLVGRHPCGGGDEPFQGVYDGYKPAVFGYRLYGANCLFADGFVLTVSEKVSPKTMSELLRVEGDKPTRKP
jgi:hypothetical protein